MATVTGPARQHNTAPAAGGLRVSRYDQVSSLLIALLIMVGFFVLLMFIIWLTTRNWYSHTPIPIELVEYAGRGDHAEGFERDLEEPGLEEMEELEEPQIQDTLEAVTDVVSTQAAALDSVQSNAVATTQGEGGMGDSRGPGPLGEGVSDIVPPWDRWEIRYTTSGIDAYARQLDFFKIELAAAGGGMNKVQYASNLSGRPVTREGLPADEKRIYMTWQGNSPLAAFDRQLLSKAGINPARRLVLQFYPKDTEKLLFSVEVLAAREKGHTDYREFLKTIFGVRPAGNGYEFYVIEQYFRPAPAL